MKEEIKKIIDDITDDTKLNLLYGFCLGLREMDKKSCHTSCHTCSENAC